MLTARGWWFFAIVLALLLVAVSLGVASLTLIMATLAIWFLVIWTRFAWQTRDVPRRLVVRRELRSAGGAVSVVWARQPFSVHVELEWTGGPTLPFVLAIDRVPILARWELGEPWARGVLRASAPLTLDYRVVCPAAGRLRFDGLKVIVADPQGFFHRTTFVRHHIGYRVLPPLVDGPEGLPSRKRHNTIPLAGTHRLVRPGGGSELLDLRDYLSGDPPKLIAWKASAKRDRLITKELESEVPVRCTLFVDASSSTRIGPVGRNALARLVEIAAVVLNANTERRDLTGLCLFDEDQVGRFLRPGRGRRAYFEMLHLLADSADRPPLSPERDLERLIPMAIGLAQDLYPDWLEKEVNGTPWYSPPFWRQSNRWRKKVAAILAHAYHLGPGGVMLLYHDDQACHRYLTLWLTEHRVSIPTLLYDESGRYAFRFPRKITILAKALLGAVTRAKDNELFILLVDLFDQQSDLGPLEKAIKAARARHHQVQVVCPWPPGVPLPDGKLLPTPLIAPNLQELLSKVFTSQLHHSFAQVRQSLGRLGVIVTAAPLDQTVPKILQTMQRLRMGGRR